MLIVTDLEELFSIYICNASMLLEYPHKYYYNWLSSIKSSLPIGVTSRRSHAPCTLKFVVHIRAAVQVSTIRHVRIQLHHLVSGKNCSLVKYLAQL